MTRRPDPNSRSIGDALFGKTRQAVLGLLFGRAGRSYHVREIIAVTGTERRKCNASSRAWSNADSFAERLAECALLLLLVAQRHIVRGLIAGAVK